MAPNPTVENPAHIDPERNRRLPTAAIAVEFGLDSRTSLADIRAHVQAVARPGIWRMGERMVRLTPLERVPLVAAAEALCGDADVDVTGNLLGRSATYGWHYLLWMRPLIRASAATGDERFARRFCELFTEWDARRDEVRGQWESLDPIWYSLGVSERASVILEALELLGDALTDEVWGRMIKVLIGGARWSFDEHTQYRTGNWQVACAARLHQVAMAFPTARESPEWAQRGRDRLVEHLERDFTDDGGHSERSPGYHVFCLDHLQTCAAIGLASGDVTIAHHPRLRLLHEWLGEMTLPQGSTLPFQDTTLDWPAVAMLRGSALCNDGASARLAHLWLGDNWQREVDLLPEQLQRRMPAEQGPEVDQRESVNLAASKYVSLRSPHSSSGLGLTLNYGPRVEQELESHSHLAALDLVAYDRTGVLLWEAGGPDSYDDPHYHDWFQSTSGHNAVVLGGQDLDSDYRARLDRLDLGGDVEVIRGHHAGYQARVTRTVTLVRADPAYLVIDDEVDDDDEVAVQWLHGIDEWHPGPAHTGQQSWWEAGKGRVRVAFLGATGVSQPRQVGTTRVAHPAIAEVIRQPLYSLTTPFTRRLRAVVVPGSVAVLPVLEHTATGLTITWPDRADEFDDRETNRGRASLTPLLPASGG